MGQVVRSLSVKVSPQSGSGAVVVPSSRHARALLAGLSLTLFFVSATTSAAPDSEPDTVATPAGNAVADNAAATPEGAGTVQKFDILHFIVDGNTTLPAEAIEAAVYPYMGEQQTLESVESARRALETAYVQAGYQTVLVDIPEQDVIGGVVRLKVTEGRVERLRVTGSRYFSLKTIREEVPSLAEGQVPHLPSLQAELVKAGGATPDRRLNPTLRAGRTPGTLEADIEVEDDFPLHGGIELNARNSVDTSFLRLVSSIRYDNLWQRFHSAALQFQISPQAPDEVQVLAGTYVLPLPGSDWRMAAYAVKVDSESAVNNAGALAVIGNGQIFGARLVRPIDGPEGISQSLSLGVDYKDFDQSIVLLGADSLSTPISYLPFSLRYDFRLSAEDAGFSRFGVEANFSLRGLGNDQQEFEDKRFLARASYAFLGFDLEHLEIFPEDYRIRARFSGQVSDSPLISNEQYSLGGAESVRGYFESEVLGDDGAFASVDLQSRPLGPASWRELFQTRVLLFADAGHVWVRDALPGTAAHTGIASTGVGLRLLSRHGTVADLDWGYRLLDPGVARNRHQRFHFQVSHDF
jgi:hemolysin activation/secretion protein